MEEATTLVECCDELCFRIRGERGGEGDDIELWFTAAEEEDLLLLLLLGGEA